MLYITQRPPKRCEVIGHFIVEHGATVREAAKQFGISKSTVHKDVTSELRAINLSLYEQVYEILQKNKEERHLRGGEATRKKYKEFSKKKEKNDRITHL